MSLEPNSVERLITHAVARVRRWGKLHRTIDAADLTQSAHLALIREFGPDFRDILGEKLKVWDVGPIVEWLTREIGREAAKLAKRTQRYGPEVPICDFDVPTAGLAVDLILDLEAIITGLEPIDKRIWDDLCAGEGVAEIAKRLGLGVQPVYRRKASIFGRLVPYLKRSR